MIRPATAVVCATLLATLCFVSLLCTAQTIQDRYVDVEGSRVHITESGAKAPAVVFESGMGEDVATWNDVQPQVSQFAHTFAYDRPGIGKSAPLPHTRTMPEMAAGLHAVLHAAGIQPPYILVGHSLGGALVLLFAHAYPKEVAGLVLVDPADPRLDERLRSHMSAADWTAREKALDEAMPAMSPTVKGELAACQKSAEDLAKAFPLPAVPTVLLTGTKKNPEFPGNPLEQDLKLELHNELMAKVPHGKHVLVPNSRHYIQNDAPEEVIKAIREVAGQIPVAGAKKH